MSTPPLPAGYALDSGAAPPLPAGYALDKPAKKYLPGREFGMDVARGMGLDADKIAAAEDAGGQTGGLKEIGSQVLEGLKGVLKDPFNIVKAPAGNFEEAVNSGSPGKIMGALSTILGGAESTEGKAIPGRAAESARTAMEAPGKAREAVGAPIHTPEGALTPTAEMAGKTIGGVIGAGAGAMVGHEYLGAAAGYKVGPYLLDKAFPEPKNVAQARAQVELLQAKAEDLMRRGKEQEALDKKQAAQERLAKKSTVSKEPLGPEMPTGPDWTTPTHTEIPLGSPEYPGPSMPIPMRMKVAKLASPEPPSLFPGATGTATPVGTAQLPPANLADLGRPTPFGQPQMVSKFQSPAAPEPGRILSPDAPPVHVEGSYWSFKEPALRQAVLKGDRAAAVVYRQRFGKLPAGASYLSDVGSAPLRGLYKSEQ